GHLATPLHCADRPTASLGSPRVSWPRLLPTSWTSAFGSPGRVKSHSPGPPCALPPPPSRVSAPASLLLRQHKQSPMHRQPLPRDSKYSGLHRIVSRTFRAAPASTTGTRRANARQSLCQIPPADIPPPEPLDRSARRCSREYRSCRV